MFCPKCDAEFRAGVVRCPDCRVALVVRRPAAPKAEWEDLVTVFTSNKPALIAVAKSLLEAADISYFAKGELLPDLAPRESDEGINTVTGYVDIQVSPQWEREARGILANLGKKP